MNAGYHPIVTTWCSLALVFMTLMVAACSQQPPEPLPNNTPIPPSNTSDAYDFPIKPGTDAWRAFNSHDEMLNACQIPEPLLKNMSTSGLVETVMNYPLFGDILAYNNPQIGINRVSAQFNGLSELLKRKDAGTVLLNIYAAMDPAAIPDNWTDLQKGDYSFNFLYIETVLAQESILSTLTIHELEELMEQANTKFQAQQNNSEVYDIYSMSMPIWVLSRVMLHIDYPPFKQEVSENEMLSTFTRDGTLHNVPSSVWDDIFYQTISISEQYLSGK